ncbi:hypothetical protein K438DRAFT_1769783 [Mycena galopus ATCC 62051]|nr:hypothetical protein K438DRAFT_1769783 [Mycena galopus ATCC 62051]
MNVKKKKLGVGPARMPPTFESLKVGLEINVHTHDAEWRMELTHYHYHRCCMHIVRQGGQAMNAGERGEGGTKDPDGSSSRYKAQTSAMFQPESQRSQKWAAQISKRTALRNRQQQNGLGSGGKTIRKDGESALLVWRESSGHGSAGRCDPNEKESC